MVLRAIALPAMLAALAPSYQSSIEPLPRTMKEQLEQRGFWHRGCPVPLSDLRLLTVSHRGFRGGTREGQLVVNKRAARPLARVFRKLYRQNFPIRHMRFADVYGPRRDRPRIDDVSGSFECRQAVPSPCTGGKGTRSGAAHPPRPGAGLN